MVTNNFNLIDRVIFSVEAAIKRVTLSIRDEKAPDPEEMILAATQHLQEENEQLKDFRIPEKVAFDEEKAAYRCPKCGYDLSQQLVEEYKIKHCIECGKRLFRLREEIPPVSYSVVNSRHS